ncbi:MAG: hypothetical protein R2784_14025 [Saprospiraceae bacterium]
MQFSSYLVGTGQSTFDIRRIGGMEGVWDIHQVSDAYKMVSKKWKVNETCIDLGNDIKIGNGHFQIMAGLVLLNLKSRLKKRSHTWSKMILKSCVAGCTNPGVLHIYSFQELGIEGLKMFNRACQKRRHKNHHRGNDGGAN